MADWLAWVSEHPGAAAWAVFLFLTAFVIVWARFEARLVAWAEVSQGKTDDKIVAGIGRAVGLVAILLDFVREIVPHFAAKRRGEPSR